MDRRVKIFLATAAMVAFAVAPEMGGARVGQSVVNSYAPGPGTGQLILSGGPLADHVRIVVMGGRYQVRDSAGVSPGDNCQRVSSQVVNCVRWEQDGFDADLGPGDDRLLLDVPDRTGAIHGGAGSDLLTSSQTRNVLVG